MGSETSKLQAPEEFGQSGNQFQIVSPKSDLSCPSDFHRIQRLRSQQNQQPKPLPAVADPNRRMSRTITKTLHHPPKKPSGVPPPSQFYFPTKETERAVERRERSSLESEKEKENDRPKMIFQKTKNLLRKTHEAMAGCLADNHAVDHEAQQRMDECKHYPVLGIARKVLPQKSLDVSDHDVKHSFKTSKDSSTTQDNSKSPPKEVKQSAGYNKAQATLHQADDYFTRLSGGSVDESPYVQNKAFKDTAPALVHDEPDTPVSNLFIEREERSVFSRTVDSIIGSSLVESDMNRNRQSRSPTKPKKEVAFQSPSNSALEYQKAVGTIAETPGYYPEDDDEDSDPVFSDDALEEDHPTNALTTIAEKADDESSATSDLRPDGTNAVTAFRPRQHVVYPLTDHEPADRRVSKLESLFRPVLPSLSADDAETAGSYDPWEIKVTESAPSVIESADYRMMALGRKNGSNEYMKMTALEKKLGGHSPSMLSIDSQVDASPAFSKEMVSKQAQYNSDFLFAADCKKSKLAFQAKGRADRESDIFSISTISARSRLPDHAGTKAVVIPHNKSLIAYDDQSQYSKEVDRQVRFSLLDAISSSVGLAPKESIDVPTIESRMSDLTDTLGRRRSSVSTTRSSVDRITKITSNDASSLDTVPLSENSYNVKTGARSKKDSNSPYIRFQSAKTKFQSHAPVEVPEIQNKISDLTEDTVDFKGRASAGSFNSIPEPIPEEAEIYAPESVAGKSEATQIHWSYSVKEGNISAVTPYFGKDTKHATKSPYIRFENAKSKFSGKEEKKVNSLAKKETAILKKETSIVKKKSPYKSPRSIRVNQGIKIPRELKPGGSVASKVQALNQRVVEAKLDRKKHRWTKSNPRKYGIIESNAVRTRAIVQYKTNVIGLDKINYMSAAKFNQIPIDDDDSTIGSHTDSQSKKSVKFMEPAPLLQLTSSQHTIDPEYDDEVASKVSAGDWSKLTADTASVATLRQVRSYIPNSYSTTANGRISAGTHSTTSSGFTNVKKQVFRSSASSSESKQHSLASHGESTTMSSILGKENSNYLAFRAAAKSVKPTEQAIVTKTDLHLSPTQRTPMQAQKWRTLAAAAHLRDSQKKQNHGKARKALAVKSANTLPLTAYGQ